jgi:hypothetical protein
MVVRTLPAQRLTATGLVLSLALAFMAIAPRPAAACSCAEPPPPNEALADSDAVFMGEVVETRTVGDGPTGELIARMAVEEVWKGDVTETVEVRTGPDSAMCGYHFTSGSRDLIYAGQRDDGSFTTHLCTRSAPVEHADEDLAAFGDGSQPHAGEQLVADGSTWPWATTAAALALLLIVGIAWRIRRPDEG